jgi:predicted acylesterase/phospholipase RssA
MGGASLLTGCATLPMSPLVPAQVAGRAEVSPFTRIRLWGDASPAEIQAYLAAEAPLLKAQSAAFSRSQGSPTLHSLSISGGADDGAFSAGLIVGWGQRGDRPTFELVTGVSAGSLVAPFAFLGRDYDAALATVFTANSAGQIYRATPLSGLLGGPSVADNAPLAALIASYVDTRMMRALARERSKGRYLIIGTTNLHAERPVFWDIGRIAQTGTPEALELIRKVLLASAALPGIFPPVEISVEFEGKRYSEFHVDGGPTRQVFLSPIGFSFREVDAIRGIKPRRRAWVIRNGKLRPEYETTTISASSIAVRALATLTKNQSLGDLNSIYERARADGIDFNLASIPMDFEAPRPSPFALEYMTPLYEKGVEIGRAGNQWAKAPPAAISRGR